MDQLAHELGIDPVELRLRNEPDRLPDARPAPTRTAGPRGHGPRGARVRLAGEKATDAYRLDARSATAWRWPTTRRGPCRQPHPSAGCRRHRAAALRVPRDGHGHRHGPGTGRRRRARVPYDAVRVEYGDTDLPIAPGAGGSAQSASVAGSIGDAACEDPAAGPPLGRPGRRTAGRRPRAHRTRPRRGVGRLGHGDAGHGRARCGSSPRRCGTQRRWVRAASGAHFCEVHVDRDTGEIRVARWVGAFDVGRVLNAKTVASQLRGGIVMGLGLALTEETLVDPRTGRIMSASLADYHVPGSRRRPRHRDPCARRPGPDDAARACSVPARSGSPGVGAAVANAVYDATGRRVTDLPVTLDKVVG